MKNSVFLFIFSLFLFGCEKDNKLSVSNDITDFDGNIYHSVVIGNQEWMVENLSTTHLNDGTDIKLISSDNEWMYSTYPSYCWPSNTVNTDNKHGLLYNYYAVKTGKLAPKGWHIPSDEEWKELEMYIGMPKQEVDQRFWRGMGMAIYLISLDWPGVPFYHGECDQYGFSALPAGGRNGFSGSFTMGAIWWSSTESELYFDSTDPWLYGSWVREITGDDEYRIGRSVGVFQTGLSIRCIKNK